MNREKKNQKERWLRALFFFYVLVMIKLIIFKYSWSELSEIVHGWRRGVIWEGLSTANFTPFKTIHLYLKYYNRPGIKSFENLYGNILIFIPFGYLLSRIQPVCRHILVLGAYGFLFILSIEIFQLFSAFGAFDVDDIVLNMLGCLIGGCVYHFVQLCKTIE